MKKGPPPNWRRGLILGITPAGERQPRVLESELLAGHRDRVGFFLSGSQSDRELVAFNGVCAISINLAIAGSGHFGHSVVIEDIGDEICPHYLRLRPQNQMWVFGGRN